MTLRLVGPRDNEQVAKLIRSVMTEFGAIGEGYSIMDPEVDSMYESYTNDRSAFFVFVEGEEIFGCGGIGPLKGGSQDTCELKKMYFFPKIRGKGMGQQLIEACLEAAREKNYTTCYIETIPSMEAANYLYQKNGFELLKNRMGDTGHNACNTCYALKL